MFQRVKTFNSTFGVALPERPLATLDDGNVTAAVALIDEEYREFKEAVAADDRVEALDAIVDLIYVVLGAGARFGFDVDKAFDLVHLNNMSKMCATLDSANATVKHYKDHPELGFLTPAIRPVQIDGERGWVVYNEDTKKILKPLGWKPVDLTVLFDK
jgi:predicted HAD superfamily Cof-like phosphohydrolase